MLTIIPARGGSKGVPRKNLRRLAGKPLVAHTIECARLATSVDRVVVSTDDPEIGTISQQLGAEVVWRPAEISGDLASSESALLHALEFLKKTEGYEPELVVFLQCTSPLTLPEDVDGTVGTLLAEKADSALAVAPFHYFIWRLAADGDAVGVNHDKHVRLLRQQREAQYRETGAVYVMRTRGFLQAKHRFFGKTALYVTPAERCFEIDEVEDLVIAEALMQERARAQKTRALPSHVATVALDFDGVFTDNKVLVFQDGSEAVLCDRGDGWGLAQLRKLDIPAVVISTEENPVVRARCSKLGIECIQGVQNKLAVFREWLGDHGIDIANAVYLGNDVNDLSCLEAVGCGVVVADAHPDAKSVASVVLETKGGFGAIRELCDLIAALRERRSCADVESRLPHPHRGEITQVTSIAASPMANSHS